MSAHFTYDEQLIMAFYYTGTKAQLVSDLMEIITYLDVTEESDRMVRGLIESALEKLEQIDDQELHSLMAAFIEDGSRLDINDATYSRVFESLFAQPDYCD